MKTHPMKRLQTSLNPSMASVKHFSWFSVICAPNGSHLLLETTWKGDLHDHISMKGCVQQRLGTRAIETCFFLSGKNAGLMTNKLHITVDSTQSLRAVDYYRYHYSIQSFLLTESYCFQMLFIFYHVCAKVPYMVRSLCAVVQRNTAPYIVPC